MIAGVSWLYRDLGDGGPSFPAQLDAVKERLYRAVAKLEWLSLGQGIRGRGARRSALVLRRGTLLNSICELTGSTRSRSWGITAKSSTI